MTLYTLIGDPHAKPDNLDKINQLFDIIEELGNPCVILGDLLDTKELVRGSCLNTYINRIQGSKLEFTLLVGNHDWFNLDCLEHSLEPLKLLKNVILVDKPLELKDFIAIPYMHDRESLVTKVASFCDSKKPLVCHVDMINFDYGNGHISQSGLKISDFADFPAVYSGHYHKFQQEKNFTYLGTPFSHSFGEANQIKYIGVFNTDSLKLDLIKTQFPRHVSLELDCDSGEVLDLTTFSKMDKIRVILKGSQAAISKYEKKPNVKYIEMPTSFTKKLNNINELNSPEVQFKDWAKLQKLNMDLTSRGLELLKDV